MSFTFNTGIPASANNPSNDQPTMQQNNVATNGILAVDHVTFNSANGGTHNHVTFTSSQATPGLSASQTQIYPKTFNSGPSAYLETFLSASNSGGIQCNGYLPFVKAMVHFTSAGVNGAITPDAGYLNVNIASVVQSGVANIITVTFATPVPNSTYFLYPANDNAMTGVTATALSTSTIVFSSGGTIKGIFSFMVI